MACLSPLQKGKVWIFGYAEAIFSTAWQGQSSEPLSVSKRPSRREFASNANGERAEPPKCIPQRQGGVKAASIVVSQANGRKISAVKKSPTGAGSDSNLRPHQHAHSPEPEEPEIEAQRLSVPFGPHTVSTAPRHRNQLPMCLSQRDRPGAPMLFFSSVDRML